MSCAHERNIPKTMRVASELVAYNVQMKILNIEVCQAYGLRTTSVLLLGSIQGFEIWHDWMKGLDTHVANLK